MVVELSCFYLVPCRRAVFHPALPTHPPRISLFYFRPSLFYPQRRLYAGSFSVRVVHYRLVRVSFASFIFFPRLPFPFIPSFLLPSISDLSHSIFPLCLRSRFRSSRLFFFFFSSSRPLSLPSPSHTYIHAAWSHVLTRVSRKNSPCDSPISAPMFSQVAPSAVPLYSRSDFWIVA